MFAYRLHVIRPREAGTEAELFSDRTAFFSGEAEDEEGEVMEAVEVSGAVLRGELDLELDGYEERSLEKAEGGDESYVVFRSAMAKVGIRQEFAVRLGPMCSSITRDNR